MLKINLPGMGFLLRISSRARGVTAWR